MRPMVRRGLVRAGWVLAFAAPLLLRVAWEGRVELRAAGEAADHGDIDGQIVHLGRALRWRLPIGGVEHEAAAELVAIAERAEQDGDLATALAAARELRSALLGSRDLAVPQADALADADARIARLMALSSRDGVVDEAAQLRRLQGASASSPARASVAALAFVGWAVASFAFLRRGIDGKGRFQQPAATRLGVLVLAALLAWLWTW